MGKKKVKFSRRINISPGRRKPVIPKRDRAKTTNPAISRTIPKVIKILARPSICIEYHHSVLLALLAFLVLTGCVPFHFAVKASTILLPV